MQVPCHAALLMPFSTFSYDVSFILLDDSSFIEKALSGKDTRKLVLQVKSSHSVCSADNLKSIPQLCRDSC